MFGKKIEDMKDDGDIDGLLNMLRVGDVDERAESAKALGLLDEKSAVQDLIKALEDEEAGVRANAALALGQIGDERAMEPLINALKDDSWVVRHDSAIALGELASSEAIKHLVKLLEDEVLEVRKKVIEALGNIGGDKVIETLGETADDKDIRLEVARALAKSESERAVSYLIDLYNKGEKGVRELTIQGLSDVDNKDKKVVGLLVDALSDNIWRIREESAKALGEVEDQTVIKPLLKALKDESLYVVQAALKSLGKVGDEEIIKDIDEFREDEEPSTRSAWAQALGFIEGEESTKALLKAVKSETHPRVIWAIANSLSKKEDESDRNLLYQELKDAMDEDKLILAVALGGSGDSRALNVLVDGIKDERWKVRQKVIEGLRNIDISDVGKGKVKKILVNLRKGLKDDDKWVRAEAVKTLGKKILEAGLGDEDIDLTKEIDALKEMKRTETDSDVLDVLEDTLSDIEKHREI
ncbi:MAG: HEAT repeat domain-containing protein [Thermoplasmata archaeon]